MEFLAFPTISAAYPTFGWCTIPRWLSKPVNSSVIGAEYSDVASE
jgi:hypothetical protein